MDKLTVVEGRAYPFGMKNVDTDIVIPAHWLKTISRNGLGKGAFEVLRKEPGNVFDDPAYVGSPILIAGDNFGCGSSREHAAWALGDLGIRVVIAPSYSDIFSGNAFKNGILTVVLPQDAIDRLMVVAQGVDGLTVQGEVFEHPDAVGDLATVLGQAADRDGVERIDAQGHADALAQARGQIKEPADQAAR